MKQNEKLNTNIITASCCILNLLKKEIFVKNEEFEKLVKFDGARKIFAVLRTYKAVKHLSEKHSGTVRTTNQN